MMPLQANHFTQKIYIFTRQYLRLGGSRKQSSPAYAPAECLSSCPPWNQQPNIIKDVANYLKLIHRLGFLRSGTQVHLQALSLTFYGLPLVQKILEASGGFQRLKGRFKLCSVSGDEVLQKVLTRWVNGANRSFKFLLDF